MLLNLVWPNIILVSLNAISDENKRATTITLKVTFWNKCKFLSYPNCLAGSSGSTWAFKICASVNCQLSKTFRPLQCTRDFKDRETYQPWYKYTQIPLWYIKLLSCNLTGIWTWQDRMMITYQPAWCLHHSLTRCQ